MNVNQVPEIGIEGENENQTMKPEAHQEGSQQAQKPAISQPVPMKETPKPNEGKYFKVVYLKSFIYWYI